MAPVGLLIIVTRIADHTPIRLWGGDFSIFQEAIAKYAVRLHAFPAFGAARLAVPLMRLTSLVPRAALGWCCTSPRIQVQSLCCKCLSAHAQRGSLRRRASDGRALRARYGGTVVMPPDGAAGSGTLIAVQLEQLPMPLNRPRIVTFQVSDPPRP